MSSSMRDSAWFAAVSWRAPSRTRRSTADASSIGVRVQTASSPSSATHLSVLEEVAASPAEERARSCPKISSTLFSLLQKCTHEVGVDLGPTLEPTARQVPVPPADDAASFEIVEPSRVVGRARAHAAGGLDARDHLVAIEHEDGFAPPYAGEIV